MISSNRRYIIFILLLCIIGIGFFVVYQNIFNVSNVYHIAISNTSSLQELNDISLAQYLEKIFKLPEKSISDIVYDTRNGSPHDENSSSLNFTYYIFISGNPIKLKPTYTDGNITARAKIADQNLMFYISDPDYCKIDSDCVIRDNFCSYGAFNYYHGFYDVWGCAESTYTELECDNPNPPDECYSSNCSQEIKYEEPECIDNRCVAKKKIGECAPWEQ